MTFRSLPACKHASMRYWVSLSWALDCLCMCMGLVSTQAYASDMQQALYPTPCTMHPNLTVC